MTKEPFFYWIVRGAVLMAVGTLCFAVAIGITAVALSLAWFFASG